MSSEWANSFLTAHQHIAESVRAANTSDSFKRKLKTHLLTSRLTHFYCATAADAMRCIAVECRNSVRVSNACTVTKWNNHLSICQHHMTEQRFRFLDATFRGPEFRGSSWMGVLKRGNLLWKAQIWTTICNNLETVRDSALVSINH